MTDLLREPMPPTRLVQTRRGDTLLRVASRELADPERWYELVFLNGLRPPYLTDDPAAVRDGVLLTGAPLRVPAPADLVTAAVDPAAVFGQDVQLTRGELTTSAGDLSVITGTANLAQAIRHVVATDLGDLLWHPRYGCGAHRLVGQRANPALLQFADALVQRAVNSDPRIDRVSESATAIADDVLRVNLVAVAVNGVSVNAVSD